jgi:glycerol-3-phosphate acyltransferase PlsY
VYTALFWTSFGFIVGSIPFSLLVGRVFLGTDIRRYADGNPGGTNAWRAGGWRVGLIAILLDILKGWAPVFLARRYGLSDWSLTPVALAPAFGHAFSPFLKFHGGKALAATGGAWLGLIGWKAFPIYGCLALPVLALQNQDAVAAVAGVFGLFGYALFVAGLPYLLAISTLNLLLIIWTHRKELHQPIQFRSWAQDLFMRRGA